MGEASFGKYRLIAELGHGGMADVFLAVIAGPAGSGFSKLTVVKRLRANLADEPEFVEMLVDEARISARLNHPNVVQTNEVGAVGNQYFISMEYLDGQPLHRIQHRAMQKAQKALAETPTVRPPVNGSGSGSGSASANASVILPTDPFPKECQYLVIVDTLAGLHHAHALADYDGTPLDIVHRDVTPHNIFVTYEGQTKVVDFGIAKAAGRASETRQGVVKGKVRYMAPEQAVGQKVDCRADVFSVGVMLWEAAAGRRLWKDMDDINIVQALVGGSLQVSPRAVNPNVPEAIDRICQKALAYNVEDRYASAEDFRMDLEHYLAEAGQLVSARRKLGPVVSELFKDKRAEIKEVIEKQLAQIKQRSANSSSGAGASASSSFTPVQIPLDSGPIPSLPLSSAGAVSLPLDVLASHDGSDAAVGNATAMTEAATELYTSGTNKKFGTRGMGARLPVFFAAGAVVVATAIFAGTRGRGKEQPVLPAAVPVETTSADVRLKISTSPPAAQVSIDGAPLTTPNDARMPRDSREHLVRVEAPGFEPYTEMVRFENDLALSIVLTTTRAPVASVTRPPPPPPPRWWPPPPTAATKPPPAIPATTTGTPTAATNPLPPTSSGPRGPKITIDPKDDPWKH